MKCLVSQCNKFLLVRICMVTEIGNTLSFTCSTQWLRLPPGNEVQLVLEDEPGHQQQKRLRFHWMGSFCFRGQWKLLVGEDREWACLVSGLCFIYIWWGIEACYIYPSVFKQNIYLTKKIYPDWSVGQNNIGKLNGSDRYIPWSCVYQSGAVFWSCWRPPWVAFGVWSSREGRSRNTTLHFDLPSSTSLIVVVRLLSGPEYLKNDMHAPNQNW